MEMFPSTSWPEEEDLASANTPKGGKSVPGAGDGDDDDYGPSSLPPPASTPGAVSAPSPYTTGWHDLIFGGRRAAEAAQPADPGPGRVRRWERRDRRPSSSRSENVILRELLNQEDEEERQEGNNMLRRLLNSEDNGDKSFRRSQDLLIQQLLKAESPDKPEGAEESGSKRKSMEDGQDTDQPPKRPNMAGGRPPTAHLAGQNPMLASMLAQTPRPVPSVPTSIANSIVSQLPQERLPKNLEKKLIHTPLTPGSLLPPQQQQPQQPQQPQSVMIKQPQPGRPTTLLGLGPQETSAMTLQQQRTFGGGGGLIQQQQQPPQHGFLSKILTNSPDSTRRALQPSQAYLPHTTNVAAGSSSFSSVPHHGRCGGGGASADQLLSQVLDDVWSLQQEAETTTTSEDTVLLRLLEEIVENSPQVLHSQGLQSAPQGQPELSEKMAISVIQQQLMSFEAQAAAQLQPQAPLYAAPVSSASYQAAPPLYNSATAQRMRLAAQQPQPQPGQPQPQQQQQQGLRQYAPSVASMAGVSPQMRRNLLERRQKIFLQQQQKRLLAQQQQQQLTMQTQQQPPDTFGPESINELLNHGVAPPNIAIQRGGMSGADAPQQLSPRFGGVLSPPQQQWTNRQSDVAFNPTSVGRHRTVVPRARRRPQQLSPGQRYSPQQPQQGGGRLP
ncbi:hypothetical protein MTO96_011377 [Rhipicephalus appendiculatus]